MAMNRKQLQSKLSTVTSELLIEKGYISFVDVFMKLGYLDPKDYENWRMKRIPYLERVIKINLGKINFIMKTVHRNCLNGNLNPSWTGYKSCNGGRSSYFNFRCIFNWVIPRQSGISGQGALHHIIARGNEKRKINGLASNFKRLVPSILIL